GGIFFLTGRGCPYGCDYCSNSLLNELYKGKRKQIIRWHSIDYIINGILYLKNGGLRQLLIVSGINFELKSETEQNLILGGFQNFLNALTSPSSSSSTPEK
ncbi:MAG: hypothetical protein AAB730_02030, partial [Patescibacteria group bacterium]